MTRGLTALHHRQGGSPSQLRVGFSAAGLLAFALWAAYVPSTRQVQVDHYHRSARRPYGSRVASHRQRDDAPRMQERGGAFACGVRRGLLAIALSFAVSGCIAEAPGTVVFGLNESDHDVIIASSHHGSPPLVLPAHTWGKLFDDYDEPDGEITVYDVACDVLARLPLTRALDTLWLGPQDEIELIGREVDQLPSGVHRAPDDPSGGGTLWIEGNCPS